VVGSLTLWWHEHNLKEQMIGRAECQRNVKDATDKAEKLADEHYAQKLKDMHDVLDNYAKDRDAATAAAADADERLRRYKDSLRARSVQGAPTAAGTPGPALVRFSIEDYSRFTDTAMSVAQNGVDDAIALKACKAALLEYAK
jgi:hypothetical protein